MPIPSSKDTKETGNESSLDIKSNQHDEQSNIGNSSASLDNNNDANKGNTSKIKVARLINYNNGHNSIPFILDDNLSIVDQDEYDDFINNPLMTPPTEQPFECNRDQPSLDEFSTNVSNSTKKTNEETPTVYFQYSKTFSTNSFQENQRMMIKDEKAKHEQIVEEADKETNNNDNYINDGNKVDLNYVNNNNGHGGNSDSDGKSNKNNLLIHNDDSDLEQASSTKDTEIFCSSIDHVNGGMDDSLLSLLKKRESRMEQQRERAIEDKEENRKKRKRNIGIAFMAIATLAVSNSLVTYVFSNDGPKDIMSTLFDDDDDMEKNTSISSNFTNCGDNVTTRCNDSTNITNNSDNINAKNEMDERKRIPNVPSSNLTTDKPSNKPSAQLTQTSSFQPTDVSTIGNIYEGALMEIYSTNETTNIDERELSAHISLHALVT